MKSVADVIKIAIRNEVQAKTFYGKASEIVAPGESQMVFIELVEMEDAHARRLVEGFGDQLRSEGVDAAAILAEFEADAEKTLDDDQIAALENAAMRPVLDFAIGMEARARDNYLSLAEQVEGDPLVALCRELAAEEQRHFDALTEARIGVDTPLEERPEL